MPQHLHSRKELETQVADLQSQLAETQELLNAICSGAVDALVVPGPTGTQIYSLKGAEQPYRVLIEEMSEGAATLASDGTVLYCNRRLADLVGAPLESVIGSAFEYNREVDRLLWVRQTYGTSSEDMESAFAAGVACGFKARFLAIRIISDSEFYAPELQRAAGEYCAAFVVEVIKQKTL